MRKIDQKPVIDHDPREFTRPPYMSPLRRIIMGTVGLGIIFGGVLLLGAYGGGGKGFMAVAGIFCIGSGGLFVFTALFPKVDI